LLLIGVGVLRWIEARVEQREASVGAQAAGASEAPARRRAIG
jgi:hypothetical protein